MGFKLFKRTNNRIRTIRRSLSRRLSRRETESGNVENVGGGETRSEQEPQVQRVQAQASLLSGSNGGTPEKSAQLYGELEMNSIIAD